MFVLILVVSLFYKVNPSLDLHHGRWTNISSMKSHELNQLELMGKNKIEPNLSEQRKKKKTYYFPLYWLFNRDPYNGLL